MSRTLSELAEIAAGCTRCRLSAGRTQVVFGSGSPTADLLFVGEGPGFHEDRQGIPFVGAAGQLLNTLLGEIGVPRNDVYICNVIKCLRYNAAVQLADGSWERIGRLVRFRYGGSVMTVLPDGSLGARRVTGWHASPLGDRRVFRLSYASAKAAGTGRVSVQLTGDHPVLTEDGYVPVQDLRSGTRIATGQGLSSSAYDVICGTVLGDGHLSRASSYLSFGHSAEQEAYAAFKAAVLAELSPRIDRLMVSAVAGGARSYGAVHIRTRAHRALGLLRRQFYGSTKKVPAWMATGLNARMLAIWFLDDGHMRIRPGRQPLAEFATNAFDERDLKVLLDGLLHLGIPASVYRRRIVLGAFATKTLSVLIAPYVPSAMRYKLHPEVAAAIPFDGAGFAPGDQHVMFDEADVVEVTDRPRTDTTFFCIDVAETHNFVTSGGVVHNCRPPGNRDPLPDEIDQCKPYLLEQVALIDPRLIVTLGNFATRVILDRPSSISRVRGQRFAWEGRTVIPTFHPAAVLRGGGAAGRQMADIRADFASVRAVLDEPVERVEEQLGLF